VKGRTKQFFVSAKSYFAGAEDSLKLSPGIVRSDQSRGTAMLKYLIDLIYERSCRTSLQGIRMHYLYGQH
jgi:hypothetical protein